MREDNNIKRLINSVNSKKGTTEAAMKVLENKNTGLYILLKKAISAAKNRAYILSNFKLVKLSHFIN